MQGNKQKYERYSFENSPWCQDLTQRDLADLLGTCKARLEALIDHKDEWVVRRKEKIGEKLRDLAYPRGKLRTIHERIKYHLNKIRQPPYVMSPRKGKSQRDNATIHKGRNQFLKLDIRQFYPATTSEHIFRWAHYSAGLRPDVAGMFAHLITIDDKLPFGSPVSPVLATLVHRSMFDDIFDACNRRGLRMSLWVDDLMISGRYVPGELVSEVREIIRLNGLQSHKIGFLSGSRPVIVTGIPIVGDRIEAPRALQDRIRNGYAQLRTSKAPGERRRAIDTLLGHLGTYRYLVGAKTEQGKAAADKMNALRQRRANLMRPKIIRHPATETMNGSSHPSDAHLPFDP
jgi:hypothetical protein